MNAHACRYCGRRCGGARGYLHGICPRCRELYPPAEQLDAFEATTALERVSAKLQTSRAFGGNDVVRRMLQRRLLLQARRLATRLNDLYRERVDC